MIHLPFQLEACPRECGKECGANLTDCPTYRMLPDQLQEIVKGNLHLLQYLRALSVGDIGIPEFYKKLNISRQKVLWQLVVTLLLQVLLLRKVGRMK